MFSLRFCYYCIMIKEFLILMLLFEISNGKKSTKLLSDFEQCAYNDTNAVRVENICVPSKDQYSSQIQLFGPKTPLTIKIANLQVIEIESYAVTLSMDFIVLWTEHRLLLNVPPLQTAFIKRKDQGRIWSPKFLIANNKILESKEQEEFGFMKLVTKHGKIFGKKKFYLYTKVRCAMDFENFPFDKHACILEVSKIPFTMLAFETVFTILFSFSLRMYMKTAAHQETSQSPSQS